MRIVAISDTHGYLPETPECDLLLIAGDFCPVRDHSTNGQLAWLDYDFRGWLKRQPAKHIIGVAGNHDIVFQKHPNRIPKGLRWEYLEDRATEHEGFKIYGTPWQPYFYDWAFNLYEEDLAKKWELIPLDTEILVLHGPPYGFGDLAPRIITDENEEQWPGAEHTGSPSLLEKIKQLKDLKLVVCGHIHNSYGVYRIPTEEKTVPLINASFVDEQYRPVNYPVTFFLEKSPNNCGGGE